MVEHEDLNSQEHNDDLLVFPPINHENLYTDGFDMERESSPTPSSSSSFGSDGPFETSIIQRWWKLLLARVLPRFRTMVSCLCSFSETLRSFYPVIVVVIWWWMRNRARRRGETEAHLRESIKERDEVCIYYSYKVFDEMHNG
ncbi:hypothetical protein YC2023_031052 [Brassica napus]